MQLASDLRKLRVHSWSERWLLLEAVAWLALGRAAIPLLSFQQIAGWLGLMQGAAVVEFGPGLPKMAATIGWAVRTVAARTHGSATCLVQTLAGAAMLRRRGIPCTLSLGIARNGNGITAHAWLGCSDVILTGAAGHERFTLISSFVARAPRRTRFGLSTPSTTPDSSLSPISAPSHENAGPRRLEKEEPASLSNSLPALPSRVRFTPEFQLLLACCSVAPALPEQSGAEAIASLCGAAIDWDRFISLVDRHQVIGRVYAALCRHGADTSRFVCGRA